MEQCSHQRKIVQVEEHYFGFLKLDKAFYEKEKHTHNRIPIAHFGKPTFFSQQQQKSNKQLNQLK